MNSKCKKHRKLHQSTPLSNYGKAVVKRKISSQRKRHIVHRETDMKTKADVSETVKARRQWSGIFKVLKENNR